MGKKQFHITGMLVLLISMSLSFSTIHNHEVLKYSSGNQQQTVEHTISKDTTLCPICGYLFHADFSSGSTAETVVQARAVLSHSADFYFDDSSFNCNQQRGPPPYA